MDNDELSLEKSTSRVKDPSPDRYKYLASLFYRFANNKISAADVAKLPRRKLRRLAEVGHFKYKYGRYDEAEEIFATLAKIDHKNYYYRSVLGGIYQKLKKWIDSVANYTIALKLNPNDVSSYVNRGEVFLRHDKYKKAAEDFRNAILMDRAGKNLWANRARSLVIALKRSIEAKKQQAPTKNTVVEVPTHPAPRTAGRR